MNLTLRLLPGRFAVCRLNPGESLPQWAIEGELWCAVRTRDELSLVCRESSVPQGVRAQGGWRCLRLEGTFPFEMTGVIASITGPLADARVPVFVISTFDTDYLLVPEQHTAEALSILRRAGHTVGADPPPA